jgi:hypothetical protein
MGAFRRLGRERYETGVMIALGARFKQMPLSNNKREYFAVNVCLSASVVWHSSIAAAPISLSTWFAYLCFYSFYFNGVFNGLL